MHITVAELQKFLDRVDPSMAVTIERGDNPDLKKPLILSEIIDGLVDAKAAYLKSMGK